MVVVMMVIVMLAWSLHRGLRLWLCRGNFQFFRRSFQQRYAACGAKPVFVPVPAATSTTGTRCSSVDFGCGAHRFLAFSLDGEPLDGLKGSGDGLLSGLGPAHVILQAGEEIIRRWVVCKFSFGLSRG